MRVALVHGFPGFSGFRIGPEHVEYFRGVASIFHDKGFEVITPELDPFGTIRSRAEQLDAAIPRDEPVHIVAHSHGGLDARLLVSEHGLNRQGVASITTICTPHRGTPVADVASFATGLLLGALFPGFTRAVRELEPEPMRAWDRDVTDGRGVRYFSYGADLEQAPGGPDASGFAVSHPLIKSKEGINDGWVSVQSARHGIFKAVLPTDHTGAIGWTFSFPSALRVPSSFNHPELYDRIAADLAALASQH